LFTSNSSQPASPQECEQRLIFQNSLEAEPSASPEGGEERQKGNEKQSAKRQVDDERDRTRERADRAMDDPRNEPYAPKRMEPRGPAWKPLPRPDTRALKKTAVVGAAIVNPVATGAVAAGVFGWKKLAKFPPFSWADKGVRKGINMAKDGARSITKTATYPFRLTGALGANVLRVAGRAGYKALDVTVLDMYRDIRELVDHKPGTNLLASALIGLKEAAYALAQYPFKLVETIAKQLVTHPIKSTVAALIGGAAIANPVGMVNGAAKLFEAVLKLITSFTG
jgi:hypothetical protein